MDYKLKIDGMSCEGCVKNISKMMSDFDNINEVDVQLESKSGIISTNSKFDSEAFIDRFNGTKFTVQVLNGQLKKKTSLISKLKNLI